ncbi:Ppx/GppA phosphatase family protein [Oricola sp.]|uniref:Ppx/GppA phosphatase family protein n=1 Tax=Oricola sp. TaxID=1979950 RepID=UPI0025CE2867|nr:Ppx/GppA phosphatase family protein [Oricola sp.]MCI5075339.1 Ppx/GppA family phosphatase [Oricola sp.]
MKETVSDARASGSGPSDTGFDSSESRPGGIAGGSPASADAAPRDVARTNGSDREAGSDSVAPDGSLDHHKDKKGRKRRRRRRGGQNRTGSTTAAPEAAIVQASPAAPAKRRRRRRKPKAQAGVAPDAAQALPAQARPSVAPPASPVSDGTAPRRRSPQGDADHAPAYYAALDLGTNNCRLLVATPTRPGQFRVVDAFSRIVRLGEGLSRTGRLSDAAMARAVEALKVCRDKLDARPIRRMRLIATEACRAAENGEEFLDRVREETGMTLEIVDRETEARLAVSGCSSLVGRDTHSVVLFDIGGGSSEIALVDVKERRSRRLADHIVAWTSLQVGVVTLSERFDGRHVSEQTFADMTDYATDLLNRFEERDRLADRVGLDGFHLLGTSGTVTTLAGIHLDLPRYDRRRVDGLWMTSQEVDAMNARLLSWSFDERVANPCIGADRADLVLAGCAILEAIRRVWPSNRLRVADRGLREGILTEMMAADGVWRRGANPWRNRTRWSNR